MGRYLCRVLFHSPNTLPPVLPTPTYRVLLHLATDDDTRVTRYASMCVCMNYRRHRNTTDGPREFIARHRFPQVYFYATDWV